MSELCKNCRHKKGNHRNSKHYCLRVRPKCKCKKFQSNETEGTHLEDYRKERKEDILNFMSKSELAPIDRYNFVIDELDRQIEAIKEDIDELDLEFVIATNVIEKETGEKVDLPEGMEELMDRYWRYVFSKLKEILNNQKGGENYGQR